MRPTIKRTIITSKTTGRRYFVVRSSTRPNGRRYYVCSKPDCEGRLARESDLFCRVHSQPTGSENGNFVDTPTKNDCVDEDILDENGEILDDESRTKEETNNTLDSNDGDNQETENDESLIEKNVDDADSNANITLPMSSRQRTKANRHVATDETTGMRSFRDSSGRLRYLCSVESCTNMLKRQGDSFCRSHLPPKTTALNEDKTVHTVHQRLSAPPLLNPIKNRYHSPLDGETATVTSSNGADGNHSEEYDSPEKTIERKITPRSFRDASGKLRFLCCNPTCHSRLNRQADIYCKKHQTMLNNPELQNTVQTMEINNGVTKDKVEDPVQQINIDDNQTNIQAPRNSLEPSNKKRKHDQRISSSKLTVATLPTRKIVLSSTTLLDGQWADVITFIRQFSQVNIATNLNVNNSTTHLLIDDSEKDLHCTITKKIVQAAARRHVFILSTRWIKECIKENDFVDEHPFEIISDSHTKLRLSIQDFQDTSKYLFDSSVLKQTFGFAIECRQCQGSITRTELTELIELSGGTLFTNENNIDFLIVLCDASEKNISKIKEKYVQTNVKTIKYVTSDFLLKSIIKFEIQDIEKYSL